MSTQSLLPGGLCLKHVPNIGVDELALPAVLSCDIEWFESYMHCRLLQCRVMLHDCMNHSPNSVAADVAAAMGHVRCSVQLRSRRGAPPPHVRPGTASFVTKSLCDLAGGIDPCCLAAIDSAQLALVEQFSGAAADLCEAMARSSEVWTAWELQTATDAVHQAARLISASYNAQTGRSSTVGTVDTQAALLRCVLRMDQCLRRRLVWPELVQSMLAADEFEALLFMSVNTATWFPAICALTEDPAVADGAELSSDTSRGPVVAAMRDLSAAVICIRAGANKVRYQDICRALFWEIECATARGEDRSHSAASLALLRAQLLRGVTPVSGTTTTGWCAGRCIEATAQALVLVGPERMDDVLRPLTALNAQALSAFSSGDVISAHDMLPAVAAVADANLELLYCLYPCSSSPAQYGPVVRGLCDTVDACIVLLQSALPAECMGRVVIRSYGLLVAQLRSFEDSAEQFIDMHAFTTRNNAVAEKGHLTYMWQALGFKRALHRAAAHLDACETDCVRSGISCASTFRQIANILGRTDGCGQGGVVSRECTRCWSRCRSALDDVTATSTQLCKTVRENKRLSPPLLSYLFPSRPFCSGLSRCVAYSDWYNPGLDGSSVPVVVWARREQQIVDTHERLQLCLSALLDDMEEEHGEEADDVEKQMACSKKTVANKKKKHRKKNNTDASLCRQSAGATETDEEPGETTTIIECTEEAIPQDGERAEKQKCPQCEDKAAAVEQMTTAPIATTLGVGVVSDKAETNDVAAGVKEEPVTAGTQDEESVTAGTDEESVTAGTQDEEELVTTGAHDEEELVTAGTHDEEELVTAGTHDEEELVTPGAHDEEELVTAGAHDKEKPVPAGAHDKEEPVTAVAHEEEELVTTGAAQTPEETFCEDAVTFDPVSYQSPAIGNCTAAGPSHYALILASLQASVARSAATHTVEQSFSKMASSAVYRHLQTIVPINVNVHLCGSYKTNTWIPSSDLNFVAAPCYPAAIPSAQIEGMFYSHAETAAFAKTLVTSMGKYSWASVPRRRCKSNIIAVTFFFLLHRAMPCGKELLSSTGVSEMPRIPVHLTFMTADNPSAVYADWVNIQLSQIPPAREVVRILRRLLFAANCSYEHTGGFSVICLTQMVCAAFRAYCAPECSHAQLLMCCLNLYSNHFDPTAWIIGLSGTLESRQETTTRGGSDFWVSHPLHNPVRNAASRANILLARQVFNLALDMLICTPCISTCINVISAQFSQQQQV